MKTFHFAVFTFFLLIPYLAAAQQPLPPPVGAPSQNGAPINEKTWEAGFSAGVWFEGDMYAGADVEKESDLLFRAWIDNKIAGKLWAGAYFNFGSANAKEGNSDTQTDFLEIGVTFKIRIDFTPNFYMKPGINIGYRMLKNDIDDADGFGLNASVEWIFKVGNSLKFFVDTGFLAQPVGGNEDIEVSFAPIPYVLVGLAY